MNVVQKTKLQYIWFILLLLVLCSNMMLYRTEIGEKIIQTASSGVVLGSLLDLVIIAPILYLAWKKQKSIKMFIVLMAAGLVFARLLIPIEYLGSFAPITWLGFAVEAGLLFIELLMITIFFKYLPRIVKDTKQSRLPMLFAFSNAVDDYVKKHQIIHIICSEMLMFYYALLSWRKKPIQVENSFTLHKNSSYIAFQIMLIHAIVIETLGFHWWLHDKSMLLSIVLLLLNVYSIIFLLADIQAVRLNPVTITNSHLYISLGLMKRMDIRFDEIESVITDKVQLKQKLAKETIDFVARDIDEVHPTIILKLKKPKEASLIMGIKKTYQNVAIKFDDQNAINAILNKYNEKR
ncbi:beta-carotene 15,15'-monooxygenase [Lysinibacillus yapensis]|uniref:Beta-carotene 15,15'-monooxygenase n=1 Tax=Ureibacillus yapensis TaxID=2304605 RepID=A0A396SB23_9BACL|nr:beta-carotene 15,15'-monooxygenase [Lysinibacillus yapensis]RHW38524.1 beta-carotene 15,15'-monooxygenase [Lysinibacillus yapensis]